MQRTSKARTTSAREGGSSVRQRVVASSIARVLAASLVVGGLVPAGAEAATAEAAPAPSSPAAAAALPPATFDWSVAPRFGPDLDGDGLIEDHINRAFVAAPLSVTLDGCHADNSMSRQTYTWTVDGVTLPTTSACSTVRPLASGTHTVRLTLGDPFALGGSRRSVTKAVSPKDLLVVSMGDSLGSGESVPNVARTSTRTALWENTRCHRSKNAGSALAAKALEDRSTKSAITFVHVACSGATFKHVTEPYMGADPGSATSPLPSQLDQVLGLIDPDGAGARPPRRIDALMVSVGINELDFGSLLVKCMVLDNCAQAGTLKVNVNPYRAGLDWMCDRIAEGGGASAGAGCDQFLAQSVYSLHGRTLTTSQSQFAERIAAQRTRYDTLARTFQDRLGMGATNAQHRVFVSDYPDITRNGNGTVCNNEDYMQGWNPVSWHWDNVRRTLPGLSTTEYRWAAERVLNGAGSLNAWIADARGRHAWRAVQPGTGDFTNNGYCALDSKRRIRRFDETFQIQGNHHGMLHPNDAGHVRYRDRYVAAIAPTLGL